MILNNKLTRESLEITYPEFRKMFAKEIQTAFESYCRTQLKKYPYKFKMIIQLNLIPYLNEIKILIALV